METQIVSRHELRDCGKNERGIFDNLGRAGPDDLTLRTGLTGVHYINLVMLLPPQSAHPGKRSS
jgi:hypothetical protein